VQKHSIEWNLHTSDIVFMGGRKVSWDKFIGHSCINIDFIKRGFAAQQGLHYMLFYPDPAFYFGKELSRIR